MTVYFINGQFTERMAYTFRSTIEDIILVMVFMKL